MAKPDKQQSSLPRIHIYDADGNKLQSIAVSQDGLLVGRRSICDIRLDHKRISREHLKIAWDGTAVTLTDLGSHNGSILDGRRLPPQQAIRWEKTHHSLQVGPFELRLEFPRQEPTAPAPPASESMNLTDVPSAAIQEDDAVAQAEPLQVLLDTSVLKLTPGQPVTVSLTIINRQSIVDHLNLEIAGVPREWVHGIHQPLRLNPNNRAVVPLTVTVPPSPDSRAQLYEVTLRARSRTRPDRVGSTTANWEVLAFTDVQVKIEPQHSRRISRINYTLTVVNSGNSSQHYTLRANDDEHALKLRLSQTSVELRPGGTAEVWMSAHAPLRLVGTEYPRMITGTATTQNDTVSSTATAQFLHRPLFPHWAVPVFVVMLLAIGIGGGFWLFAPTPTTLPQIEKFEVEPREVEMGGQVSLAWEVREATTVELQPLGDVEATGTRTHNPTENITYYLIAANQDGEETTREIRVEVSEVPAPKIEEFDVLPTIVIGEEPVTIEWRVSNDATAVEIEPGLGTLPLSGERSVLPQQDTTYVLTAINSVGQQTTAQVEVTVARCNVQNTLAGGLNFRKGPDTSHPDIGTLDPGTRISPMKVVLKPDNNWLLGRVEGRSDLVWLSANPEYISCNIELSQVPMASDAEVPTVVPTATPVSDEEMVEITVTEHLVEGGSDPQDFTVESVQFAGDYARANVDADFSIMEFIVYLEQVDDDWIVLMQGNSMSFMTIGGHENMRQKGIPESLWP